MALTFDRRGGVLSGPNDGRATAAQRRSHGTGAMAYLTVIAVAAVLLLQATSAIPAGSVEGALTIAVVYLLAAVAVGMREAWLRRRGPIGWIVNMVVTVVAALMAAQLTGGALAQGLSRLFELDGSLMRTGGPALSIALVGTMLASIFAAWLALQVTNRWR
jgi:hypothetical protein